VLFSCVVCCAPLVPLGGAGGGAAAPTVHDADSADVTMVKIDS
jgi:hypothetical protein